MFKIWCVRADFGRYTENFVKNGYAGIGWLPDNDLSEIKSREELYPLYKTAYPDDISNIVIGQQVGQIARFMLEMKSGDFIITPAANTESLHYGQIEPDPSYYYVPGGDECPYPQRRKVKWNKKTIERSTLSVPFQNTIRSSLTVFAISQQEDFFTTISRPDLVESLAEPVYDPYLTVLKQILELDDKEFEFLVSHLLTALGFEGSEVTGKTGDGGVDAIGELNVANMAKVKLYVQAKRYKVDAKISASTVRQLRQAIPFGGQGAFITTAKFQKAATEIALEPGFPRIGLINGPQLVDLLVEHWNDIPKEFQERLNLKIGLIQA